VDSLHKRAKYSFGIQLDYSHRRSIYRQRFSSSTYSWRRGT
jgi:hypothetical protein